MIKKILLILLVLLALPLATAEDQPSVATSSLELDDDNPLKPVIDSVQPFFKKISVLVGGIFGLYLILILVRIHYERKKYKVLLDVRYDLDQLNRHYNLPYSKARKDLHQVFFEWITSLFRPRKIEPLSKIKRKKK